MKPRIFREGGAWACWGGIFCQYGKTPTAAYEAWRQLFNREAIAYNCQYLVVPGKLTEYAA